MTLIIILLIAGFILVGAEVLLPGGILGVIALVLIIAATIIATNTYGGGAGMLVLFAGGLGSLITFFAMFKFIAVSPSGGGLRLDSAITGNASGERMARKWKNRTQRGPPDAILPELYEYTKIRAIR